MKIQAKKSIFAVSGPNNVAFKLLMKKENGGGKEP